MGTGISTGRGSDYAALSRLIRQDGLLNRRSGYYATKICVMAVLYIAGLAAVVALGASWYQLLAAVYLAVVFGQLAFVGHEAGTGRSSGPGGATTPPGCCSATC